MSGRKTLSPPDPVSYLQFGIEDLDLILKERRLRWYGHVERSNSAVKTAFHIHLRESVGLGGPRWALEAADREGLQRVEALGYQPA